MKKVQENVCIPIGKKSTDSNSGFRLVYGDRWVNIKISILCDLFARSTE